MPYQLVAQQAAIFPPSEDRLEKIFNRLVTYNLVKEKSDAVVNRIKLAANWADDNVAQEDEKFEVSLSETQKKAVAELLELVKPFATVPSTPENAKALQSKVFDVARNNGIEPKEFFTMLYRMFLNADRGPRIGNYFLDLGIDRATHVLSKYLA
jgi:lysyl-tRNA synthetase class 1